MNVHKHISLSIIIPLYNNAKFIERAIRSVQSQDLEQCYEVIVVDDGSTDNGKLIVEKIGHELDFVKVLSQKNQGPGIARNLGLSVAQGEYILFLDSDDYLEPHSIKQVLSIAVENNLQILFYQGRFVYENRSKTMYDFDESYCNKVMSGCKYIATFKYFHSVCGGIFNRNFICKSNVFFENQVWGEDVWFLVRLLMGAERVMTINDVCYNYIKYNTSSLTNRRNINYEHLKRVAKSRVDVVIKLKKIADSLHNGNDEQQRCSKVLDNGASIFAYYTIHKMLQAKLSCHEFQQALAKLKYLGLYPLREYEYKYRTRKDDIIRKIINVHAILSLMNLMKISKNK